MSSDSHYYTYGVIENEDLELEVDAVGGASRVYTVSHRPLAAVVSDIDTLEPDRTDEHLRTHDDVLRAVMNHDGGRTIVPMRFGMVFKDGRALKNVLRGGRGAFTRGLREVEGTVELGVKLVAEAEADLDRETIREDVGGRLEEVSLQSVENDLFSDRLVMNRSYLVDRDDRTAFDEAVEAITEEYDELTVQYSGPWAPYNFIDIEIGAQQ